MGMLRSIGNSCLNSIFYRQKHRETVLNPKLAMAQLLSRLVGLVSYRRQCIADTKR